MALLHVNFFSNVLKLSMNMDVILPQKTEDQIGMKTVGTQGKCKTMYLLHGMSDDHTIWQRRTSIERYVSELGIAVVMPTVHLGWYSDTVYGMKYWEFISKELPEICRELFPQLSDRPEDTLAAGLSMGGYGAWKLGLGATETFGAAASLSGALDIAHQHTEVGEEETILGNVFGSQKNIEGSDNDLMALAKKKMTENQKLPRLYAWCGTEDFLYEDNKRAWEYVKELGYDFTYEESPGDHQWEYWDEKIKSVLTWWLNS